MSRGRRNPASQSSPGWSPRWPSCWQPRFPSSASARTPPAEAALRLSVPLPDESAITGLALSPDGRTVAFSASLGNRSGLWLRALDSLELRPLSNIDSPRHPFWSPDGRFLGFFADGKLQVISATGGPATALCDAGTGAGGAWNREGVILFGTDNGPIQRVNAGGGVCSPVTCTQPMSVTVCPLSFPTAGIFCIWSRTRIQGRRVCTLPRWISRPATGSSRTGPALFSLRAARAKATITFCSSGRIPSWRSRSMRQRCNWREIPSWLRPSFRELRRPRRWPLRSRQTEPWSTWRALPALRPNPSGWIETERSWARSGRWEISPTSLFPRIKNSSLLIGEQLAARPLAARTGPRRGNPLHTASSCGPAYLVAG